MRVLIYGGRDFTDKDTAFAVLDYVLADWDEGELTVLTGKARGADTLGEQWAIERGHQVEEHPADWGTHGKAAGPIRNKEMFDSGIDYAVEFPGGKGTADMRNRLLKGCVKVWIHDR